MPLFDLKSPMFRLKKHTFARMINIHPWLRCQLRRFSFAACAETAVWIFLAARP